jgi:chromosome segregation ATPase
MADEPENLVLQMLRGIRADMATKVQLTQVQSEVGEVKDGVRSLRADVASDLATMQEKAEGEHKATREQVAGLRRAVVEYHSAVIGHGVLISELEARVRRVEQHLNLPALDAH